MCTRLHEKWRVIEKCDRTKGVCAKGGKLGET